MADVSRVLTVVVLSCMAVSVQGFNITAILEPFPEFSLFNQWLSATGVVNEINARSTITVLVTSNTGLQSYLSGVPNDTTKPELVADTLRYQILLTYLTWTQLEQITVGNYTSVTTLLQTTGRTNDTGFVNIYNTGEEILVGHLVPDGYGNQTVTGNVTFHAYDYSVLQISSVLIPLPTFSPAPLAAPTLAPAPSVAPTTAIPTGTRNPGTDSPNDASMTRVTLPLTLTALIVASVAVLL